MRVEEQHAQRISVAIQSPGCAGGEFDATLIDCSEGGLGLRSPVFIPKGCRLVIRIDPGDGGPIFEAVVRVMRAAMVDRGPTYYLGSSLASETAQNDAGMERVFAAARKAEAAAPTGQSGVAVEAPHA